MCENKVWVLRSPRQRDHRPLSAEINFPLQERPEVVDIYFYGAPHCDTKGNDTLTHE